MSYKKSQKKRNSPGVFPGLVVFLGVFFENLTKKWQNVRVRESLLYLNYIRYKANSYKNNFLYYNKNSYKTNVFSSNALA